MKPRGNLLLSEIREQPEALARIVERRREIEVVARRVVAARPRLLRLVAHGSSDNAASYGVYTFALLARRTAMRDSISLAVYYDAHVDMRDSVVIALSQSGQTPDVVEYVARARRRGALTVAVTNDERSDLATVADEVVSIAAGEERAVAATKTYMNQLAVLALLAAATGGRLDETAAALEATIPLVADAIRDVEAHVAALAVPFSFVGRMFVVGRGLEYATAREIALKLTEVSRVAAEALTATDLAHGPVAALDPLFPVWTIASDDESLPAAIEAAERAHEAGAALVASGGAADRIADADYYLTVPTAPTPLTAPLLSVVPGQLFAWALATAKGLDPDEPRHLRKVTLAR